MRVLFVVGALFNVIHLISGSPPRDQRAFQQVQNVFTTSLDPLDIQPQLFQTTDGRLFALRTTRPSLREQFINEQTQLTSFQNPLRLESVSLRGVNGPLEESIVVGRQPQQLQEENWPEIPAQTLFLSSDLNRDNGILQLQGKKEEPFRILESPLQARLNEKRRPSQAIRLLGSNIGRRPASVSPGYSLADDASTGYFAFPSAGLAYRY
eukprot:TRINITY_DN14530_c0_g1_i1.p1 TRINITY_DN14530_c0_g1~~TRINITY_DN14530_c0_g1_i1.p1  ORF type:complete len:209 (+),score=38.41 TRINITY_DN14530_c0_g1_i1:23-649(+)